MYSYPIGKKRVAVKVERINGKTHKYRVVPDGLCFIGENTMVASLPDNYEIVDDEGNKIEPTGRFLISTETIDPYHLVTDMF